MRTKLSIWLLLVALLVLEGCYPPATPAPLAAPAATRSNGAIHPATLPPGSSWQWQLTDLPIDASFDVDMYDIDLFDNGAGAVAALHARGSQVICYLSAGSWEDWRPDADQFPAAVLGNDYEGWPGEKWLDIRQIDLLAPIMRARLDECQARGFDGVEPDNIDSYTNDTGFPLTYQDQLDYNRWLADEAHARGLSIGLKNDDEQVADLLPHFDWALTEDCFAQGWCEEMAPFVAAGKAVFAAEYTDELTLNQFLDQVCPQAGALGFSAILKDRNLDAWRRDCPTPAPASKWSLWTGGTQLRGANVWQRRVYPELDGLEFLGPGPLGPPYTQADFDGLAALGANYVNISHPGLFAEQPPYALDTDVQANLDSLLAMAEQAGLFAVITFRTGPGRSEFWAVWGQDTVSDPENGWFDPSYYNNRVWGEQAAQDAWVAMWSYTAGRYRDNPIVAGYDLMCEPNSNDVGSYPLGDPLGLWDPAEFYDQYGGTLYDWNQLYPRLVAGIRQVDPLTPILVGGMSYSAVEWLPYLQPGSDPRTVYVVHQYSPHNYTHQEADDIVCGYPGWCDLDWDGQNDDWLDRAWLDDLLAAVDDFAAGHGVPLAVNEFGVVRWVPGAAAFMDDEMDLLEQRGLNHALWVWDPAWAPWNQQVDAFNFRHGPDPDNHTDLPTGDLLEVIAAYWGRNTVRPPLPAAARLYLPLLAANPGSGQLNGAASR